ncbi:Coiled-coil domain-containing protein 47 [Plasmodiophora brassicae]
MSFGRATWAIAVVLAVGIGAVVADDTTTPAKRVHTLRDQLRNVSVGWPEAVAALAIVAFVYVYLGGSRENESIADAWFNVVRPTLDLQFAKVGAYQGPPRDRPLIKDSCFSYRVYSSGRRNCSGLLASLELRKRQDLLSIVLSSLGVITSQDKCTIEIPLEASTMEPFVLLLCRRRDEKRVRKTYSDVEQFAVRASQPAALKSIGITVLADTPEVVSELLDQRVLKVLTEHRDLFVSLYISDQSTYPMALSPASLRMDFLLPKTRSIERVRRLVEMSVFLIDQVASLKLSAVAKSRATAARAKVAQAQYRLTHEERQQQVMQRKIEALEKERDGLSGEALKKFEQRQEKLAMKRRGPKMKIMR